MAHQCLGQFSHFSLVLLNGLITITPLVTSWIESKFDCRTTKLHVPAKDLEAVIEKWANTLYETRHTLPDDIIHGMSII